QGTVNDDLRLGSGVTAGCNQEGQSKEEPEEGCKSRHETIVAASRPTAVSRGAGAWGKGPAGPDSPLLGSSPPRFAPSPTLPPLRLAPARSRASMRANVKKIT